MFLLLQALDQAFDEEKHILFLKLKFSLRKGSEFTFPIQTVRHGLHFLVW